MDRGRNARYSLSMHDQPTEFESFVDALRRDWQVDACMAAYSPWLGFRLAVRMMTESMPYQAAPGAGPIVRRTGYIAGAMTHGSDFAVACGGGR